MNDYWWTSGFSAWSMLLLVGIFLLNSIFCLSLNHEGIALLKFRERVVNDPFGALANWNEENGDGNPCSWFGVGCVDGHVNSLNLTNLCLEGTLAPELHQVSYIKFIILRNNSFSGLIPGEIRNLKELVLIDLGYNHFCKPIPYEFGYDIPILLLDNNEQSCYISPELEDLMLSEENVRHEYDGQTKDVRHPRILQEQPANASQRSNGEPSTAHTSSQNASNITEFDAKNPEPSPVVGESPPSTPSSPTKDTNTPMSPSPQIPPPGVPFAPTQEPDSERSSEENHNLIRIVVGVVGGIIGLVVVGSLLFLLRGVRNRKATGFSGQLKRAFFIGNDRSDGLTSDKPSFIEGIPNFKRSELLTACEDFSNVIGSSSIGTIYKGTLPNGVEIAVITVAIISAKDWSKNLETQFRKKIEVLSKVNHKNFVNLIGYCEEEEPFTRLMVFEYAPNGSLFEHLHVREAEHLDWGMRLRVAMGTAYCLEHMHELTPPVTHPNLNSSAVNLSEDYAAKISDFCFWNEVASPRVQSIAAGISNLATTSVSRESNVYNFGLLFLEMMTGRIPHSLENNALDYWVLEYMRGEKPLPKLVDPMLRHFNLEQLEKISDLIRKCLHSEQHRPTMKDVTARLREITGIIQDKAVPRFSSLWWTELDARSVNGT